MKFMRLVQALAFVTVLAGGAAAFDDNPFGGGGAGGSSTLDGLSDVSTSGAANGQFLGYDGSSWGPSTPAGSGDVLKAGTQTLSGLNTYTAPVTLSGSTLTVTGNAFSVGASTLTVSGGKIGLLGAIGALDISVGTNKTMSQTADSSLPNSTTLFLQTLNKDFTFSDATNTLNMNGFAQDIQGKNDWGVHLNMASTADGAVAMPMGIHGPNQKGIFALMNSTGSALIHAFTDTASFSYPLVRFDLETDWTTAKQSTSAATTFSGTYTGKVLEIVRRAVDQWYVDYAGNGYALGNWGFGTTSPGVPLDVVKSGSVGVRVLSGNPGTFSGQQMGTDIAKFTAVVQGADNQFVSSSFKGDTLFRTEFSTNAIHFGAGSGNKALSVYVSSIGVSGAGTFGSSVTASAFVGSGSSTGTFVSGTNAAVIGNSGDSTVFKVFADSATIDDKQVAVTRQYEYLQLPRPDFIYNQSTMTLNTSSGTYLFGSAGFSATVSSHSGNCAGYVMTVPEDFDTAGTMSVARYKFTLGGGDTGTQRYFIAYTQTADSANPPATLGTGTSPIAMDFAGDASGASGDVETISSVTLTGWAASWVAGRHVVIEVCRDGDDGTNDSSTVASTAGPLVLKMPVTRQLQ